MSETMTQAEAKPLPAGFARTDASRLASDAKCIYTMWQNANAETGAKRARALTNVRDMGAAIIGDLTRDAALSQAARGVRIGVTVRSTLRGNVEESSASVPAPDVLRAIVYGGSVIGSAKLA